MRKQQITAYLPNVVGALAKATKALAGARVNIQGISVVDTADTGLVRMIVSNPARARRALGRAGIACTTQAVEVVTLTDKVGSLADATAKLAKAGVDICYVYGTTCGCGPECECRLVISACDLKKVRRICK